jgi:hypothetical protein
MTKRITVAILAVAAIAGLAGSASARWYGDGRWHDDDRWHGNDHYYGYHYRAPPVIYGTPYNYGYYAPPVIYGAEPGISLNVRGDLETLLLRTSFYFGCEMVLLC